MSSSVVPPKCNMENDKENSSLEISLIVARNVVPLGSTKNHGNSEYDKNESNRNAARDLIDKCGNLIRVIDVQLDELKIGESPIGLQIAFSSSVLCPEGKDQVGNEMEQSTCR
ncbi:hypothetical protein H5410_040927 [Solanum commersonii]|uniref:Uncharacterized protein n=1 Tax=Solanum commersonii TaxID=4109 RepID=A0A9J5XRJ6_SOLCO|nr:hypothetical protein H5410_040927 [Solanum commersonii]